MKKLLLLITSGICTLSLVFFASSCNVDDNQNVTPQEKGLNLKAPNGKELAPSISFIKNNISRRVSEELGYDVDVAVTGIEYLSTNGDIFVARISYRTSQGNNGTETWTNGILAKNNDLILANNVKTRLEIIKDPTKTYNIRCTMINVCTKCPSPNESTSGKFTTITCGDCEEHSGSIESGTCEPSAQENS